MGQAKHNPTAIAAKKGKSTTNEIIYAESIGKRVIFMEERKDG